MKLKLTFLTLINSILMVVFITSLSHAMPTGNDTSRWDMRMINEMPVLEKLLTRYWNNHTKFWNEIKTALEDIVNNYPESEFIDDALLMLACEKASSEGDIQGAIADLRVLMDRYPMSHTVVMFWEPSRGYIFDHDWMELLLTYAGMPLDNDGFISANERAVLTYFEHLEKYPRLTKDTAQLIIAKMLEHQGNKNGAISELETIIARHPNLNKQLHIR